MGNLCGADKVPIPEEDASFEEYFPDVQARGEERAANVAKAKALKKTREEAGV